MHPKLRKIFEILFEIKARPPDCEQTRTNYISRFQEPSAKDTKQIKALDVALDIRKFEIDNYWKRGTYFWTLIASAFVAAFAVSADKYWIDNLIVCCLGLLFSLAWYFVNRGSSAWQRNWEAHVDLLEDEIMGPLYKSTIARYHYNFFNLADAYPFSPSKINTIVSLNVCAVWQILIFISFSYIKSIAQFIAAIILFIITLAASYAMWRWGQTIVTSEKKRLYLRQREYL